MSETTRRAVLAGAAGATAAAILAACGTDNAPPPGAEAPKPVPPAGPGAGVEQAVVIGRTEEVPILGGKIFVDQAVVVTQPEAGQFKAFSATCTHKGCLLAGVEDGAISCRCHGARFAVTDGSVLSGPAKEPLAPRTINVVGDQISMDPTG